MLKRRILVAALVLGWLLLAVPAVAQTDVLVPGDDCFEVDHSGSNPFGSPSALRVFITLPPEYAGSSVNLFGSGASGDISGFGAVEESGLTIIDLPLFSFGGHMIDGGILDPGGMDLSIDTSGLSNIIVDSSEPTCDPNDLVFITAETATTTSSPPETTTTILETTTTSLTTTTTVGEDTTTTSTAPETDDEGRSGGWVFPILGGLTLVIIGGAVIWRGSDDPCKEELEAWMAARAACDKARADADRARAKCDDAEAVVEELEAKKKTVCKEWPPACWDSEDGGWIEESGRPETRITQRDLHLRRMALGAIWDDYKDGRKSAQEVEEAWKEADTPEFREDMRTKDAAAEAELAGIETKLTDAQAKAREACEAADAAKTAAERACEKAAAAKAAYDACMGAAAPPVDPPKEPSGPEGPTTPPPTGGGTGPGTAPPPTDPPSTPPDDEPEEPICCPSGMWMGYGWTTGGMLFVAGYESSIMHFVCLSHPDRWVTMSSRSFRFGLGLGGETALFGAFMWGVPHGTNVPRIWREKAASGIDFDLSFGPSVTKGIKNVIKDAGLKQAGGYLRWAAKQKVPPSALDPRRMENLRKIASGAKGGAATGTGRSLVSQGAHPQVIVFPLGAGLQVGAWLKSFATTEVTDFRSCGCPWPQ